MNYKKITAFLLAASLLAVPMGTGVELGTCITAQAEEVSGTCGEGLTWTLDDEGTLTISGEGPMANFWSSGPWKAGAVRTVVIGEGVTSIGEHAFDWCEFLTDVTIPSTVMYIGRDAFSGCQALTEITLPEGLVRIGNDAFSVCNALTAVTIPASVEVIGSCAFSWCEKLADVTILNPDCEIWEDSVWTFSNKDTGFTGTIHGYDGSTAEVYARKYDCKFASLGEAPLGSHASGTCGETLTWTLEDGTLTISGEGEMADFGSAVLPGWSGYNDQIGKAVIGDGVTRIGANAFSGCAALADVTILNPDCEIYDAAGTFSNAAGQDGFAGSIHGYDGSTAEAYARKYGRTFVSLGEAPVVSIVESGTCGEALTWTLDSRGALKISGTGDMTEWPSPMEIPWFQMSVSSVVIGDGVTSISGSAFMECGMTSIKLPDSVTKIGDRAFSFCEGLTSVTIPASVTEIGEYAFSGTPWLKAQQRKDPLVILNGILIDGSTCGREAVIPEGVTSISGEAFDGCIYLTDVTIPASVTSIGQFAFSNIPWLTAQREKDPLVIANHIVIDGRSCKGDVVIPDDVTSISGGAFHYSGITSVTIPAGVTSIADETFHHCSALTSVTIPGTVTEIGDQAFYGCSALQDLTLPEGLTSIGTHAFSGCEGLTTVTIPEGVKRFGISAFWNCTSLTDVTISEGVKCIGDAAFSGCTSLTNVTIPESVTSIGGSAFDGTPWLAAQQEQDPLVIVNQLLINGKTCEGEVTIPDGVTCICGTAFHFCTEMTAVTIPDTVTSIGMLAFWGCSALTDVTILNPDCKIDDAASTFINDGDGNIFTGTIHGYDGSTAEAYAKKYGRTFVSLGEAPAPALTLGDLNGDKQVNASDAARILMASATAGVTGDTGLTAAETAAADVTKDGKVDASDAAKVLMYSAAVGTGFQGSMEDYLQ